MPVFASSRTGPATGPLRPVRVGLDVGGTKVDGVAVGPGQEVLATVRRPTSTGVAGVVATAAAAVADLVADLVADPGPPGPGAVSGVGIGIPGLVDPAAGTVRNAVNLGLGPDPVDLAGLVSTALGGVPVAVENDVNASTLGAYAAFGPGTDLALLSLGTGLAAGIVVGGRLLRGSGGAAGEIGHLALDPRGLPCNCGQRGCLETVAAGSALRRDWPHGDEGRSAEHLFAAAAAGDPAATEVLERWSTGVALAVRTLALTCDPGRIVLAGGVAAVGEPLLRSVSDALRRQARSSVFLRGLALHERLALLPPGRPVAAIGAAAQAPAARAGRG
ncbi:putative NBD/HSP70 family sugar kinase [Kineococcus radiotolerans]|uniref:ROK family protein n=2 Tax=Kineococcus radiotolerans TaxID=131568 RepID=A6WEF8_KINRD|nr:ROK family protein [Kineococcus radiotolerans]ABS05197.1 ROK family protein [Kineococcus radiotolerans SRS30216 = ATCC BAA-149]MBB2902068.1 putative NBD/HSP70 family sugar kinase [Kineococcus radiotolerans]